MLAHIFKRCTPSWVAAVWLARPFSHFPSSQRLDNSGVGLLRVPGFSGVPLNYRDKQVAAHRDSRDIADAASFTNGLDGWSAPRLTSREIAMIRLMDSITDKPGWDAKILDERINAKWRAEAAEQTPLISEAAWSWCVDELRDQARHLKTSRAVRAIDSASRVIKADRLMSSEFRKRFQSDMASLINTPNDLKDWHPGTERQVVNYVHPSLFPLVYGRSRVLSKGGTVDLQTLRDSYDNVKLQTPRDGSYDNVGEIAPDLNGGDQSPSFYSKRFQWLPCEVEFLSDKGTDVQISSYINNLHPSRHRHLYSAIEEFIGQVIPLWNDVLILNKKPRSPLRIITFRADLEPAAIQSWADDELIPTSFNDERFAIFLEHLRGYLEVPDSPEFNPHAGLSTDSLDFNQPVEDQLKQLQDKLEKCGNSSNGFKSTLWEAVRDKEIRIRRVVHPDPTAMKYQEWKTGVQRSVNPPTPIGYVEPGTIASDGVQDQPNHSFYKVNVENEFRDQGLQVIVKLASIELTPQAPDYSGGSWHLEGMQNEQIVATAIYYFDVDNVTDARLGFRQEANLPEEVLVYDQDDHGPLSTVFGTAALRDEPAVQEIGSVATLQDRVVVFPNTLQHALGPFRLKDSAKPGHRRVLVVWLVDPHYRICSTRNVLPQSPDWYGKGDNNVKTGGFRISEGGITLDGAKELRLELMKERTRTQHLVEDCFETYNLCEH